MTYNNLPYYLFGSIICVAIVFLSSCASINKDIETREYEAHPLPRDQVRIVMKEAVVTQCHHVATFRAESGSPVDRINKLRKEAGKLGANVLLLIIPKPWELITPEDILGYFLGAVVIGGLTGDTVAPSPEQPMYVDAKAFHCD